MSNSRNQLVHHGSVIDLVIEEIHLPDGRIFSLEIVHHPGGAAVVAVNVQHQVWLIHQYRHVAQGMLWELPAGKCNPAESPLLTAKRELSEEAGLIASEWHELGTVWSSPGIFTERIYLYLAQDIHEIGHAPEADEYLEPHWIDLDQALAWAADGTICDGKSIVGLFRAARMI